MAIIAGENPKYNKERLAYAQAMRDNAMKQQPRTAFAGVADVLTGSLWDKKAQEQEGLRLDYEKQLAQAYGRALGAKPLPWQEEQTQQGAMADAAALEAQSYPEMVPDAMKLGVEAAKPEMTPYQQAQIDILRGNQDIKANKAAEPSFRDQMRMNKSQEAADAAAGVEQLMGEASGILSKYETSKAAPIVGKFGQITNAIGLASDDTKKRVTDYESLDKISKDLGVQTLKQFGGNDTDKELQVAIQTNIDPEATVEANMNTIKRKVTAAQILQQKPDFEAQWVAKAGGLNNLDPETGQSFGSAWRDFQKSTWSQNYPKAPRPEDNDTNDGWTIEEVQ